MPGFITHHQLAAVSLAGSCLDMLGALYLAYDILGGKHGPLRALTRGVTYGVLFGGGYSVALGLPFGIAAGAAHGLTLAFEMTRAAKRQEHYAFRYEFLFCVIRGVGFAVGASYIHGPQFGIGFGTLSALGQAFAYRMGIRPAMDYEQRRAPRLTRRQVWAALNRTVGAFLAGCIAAFLAGHQEHAWMLGTRVGLGVGVVTAMANAAMPFIEWASDIIPDRRLGVLGVVLILIGFTLQSLQYWVALFDVPVSVIFRF